MGHISFWSILTTLIRWAKTFILYRRTHHFYWSLIKSQSKSKQKMVHTSTYSEQNSAQNNTKNLSYKYLIIEPTGCTNFSIFFFYFGMQLYMFRTVLLSIISFPLYFCCWWCTPPATELNQFHPDPARKLSANLYDLYHCCVYSE